MDSRKESIVPAWYRLEFMQLPERKEDLAKIYKEESPSDSSEGSCVGGKKTSNLNEMNSSVDSVFVTCESDFSSVSKFSTGANPLRESLVLEWNQKTFEEEEEKKKVALREMSLKELSKAYKKSVFESERLEKLWEDLHKLKKVII